MSIVRDNLMTREGYTGYCGDDLCKEVTHGGIGSRRWPRTVFNGEQFRCPNCGWTSGFPEEFIKQYKDKWSKQ